MVSSTCLSAKVSHAHIGKKPVTIKVTGFFLSETVNCDSTTTRKRPFSISDVAYYYKFIKSECPVSALGIREKSTNMCLGRLIIISFSNLNAEDGIVRIVWNQSSFAVLSSLMFAQHFSGESPE